MQHYWVVRLCGAVLLSVVKLVTKPVRQKDIPDLGNANLGTCWNEGPWCPVRRLRVRGQESLGGGMLN